MRPDTSPPAWGPGAGWRAGRCSGSAGSARPAAARRGRSGCTAACWRHRSTPPCCRCPAAGSRATRPAPPRRTAARGRVCGRMSRTRRRGWRRSDRTRQCRSGSVQQGVGSRAVEILADGRAVADRPSVADHPNLADRRACAKRGDGSGFPVRTPRACAHRSVRQPGTCGDFSPRRLTLRTSWLRLPLEDAASSCPRGRKLSRNAGPNDRRRRY